MYVWCGVLNTPASVLLESYAMVFDSVWRHLEQIWRKGKRSGFLRTGVQTYLQNRNNLSTSSSSAELMCHQGGDRLEKSYQSARQHRLIHDVGPLLRRRTLTPSGIAHVATEHWECIARLRPRRGGLIEPAAGDIWMVVRPRGLLLCDAVPVLATLS